MKNKYPSFCRPRSGRSEAARWRTGGNVRARNPPLRCHDGERAWASDAGCAHSHGSGSDLSGGVGGGEGGGGGRGVGAIAARGRASRPPAAPAPAPPLAPPTPEMSGLAGGYWGYWLRVPAPPSSFCDLYLAAGARVTWRNLCPRSGGGSLLTQRSRKDVEIHRVHVQPSLEKNLICYF